MAKFLNPLTGQYEDDGTPDVSSTMSQNIPETPSNTPTVESSNQGVGVVDTPSVPQTVRLTNTETITTRPLAGPGEKQAQGKVLYNLSKQEKLATELGQFNVQEAEAKAKQAEELRIEREKQQSEREAKRLEEQAKVDKAEEERKLRYDDYVKNNKIKDYWEDKSTGDRVLAGIAVALGGIGAGLTKTDNSALKIIENAIDRDFRKQKENIEARKQTLEEAGRLTKEARDNYNFSLSELDNKHSAAYQTALRKYEELAARRGITGAKLEFDATVLGLQQKRNQLELEAARSLKGSVTSKSTTEDKLVDNKSNKPTESQGKAATFAKRMSAGIRDYDNAGGLSEEGSKKVIEWMNKNRTMDKNGIPVIGSYSQMFKELGPSLSSEDRRAYQALNEIITARLRRDSGAAIGAEEWDREFAALGRLPGDDEEVLKQKRRTMRTSLAAIQSEARGDSYSDKDDESERVETSKNSKFPMTVRKNGESATVSNQQELDEATKEGWK